MDTKSSDPIFTDWTDQHTALWGHQPLRLQHRLHTMPLFSRESLAQLIDTYPRDQYSLIHMGARGDRRFWREGDTGGLPGEAVIDAISKGRMWLNLRNVLKVDKRFADVADAVFAEMAQRLPGFSTRHRSAGILISSPGAQVYYHADLPGQHLWQLIGRKRVYVYPNSPPFLTERQLEDIALFEIEVDLPYEPWYDEHARVLELEPGQMLSWPLNAPHRVENLDCLNVSMTVSFTNEEIHRLQNLNLANGLLRHRLGIAPKSRSISGPSYWSKAVLQKALRNSSWVRRERHARRVVDFRLDGANPGQIIDAQAAA